MNQIFIMSKVWCREEQRGHAARLQEQGKRNSPSLNANGTGPFRLVRQPDVKTIWKKTTSGGASGKAT